MGSDQRITERFFPSDDNELLSEYCKPANNRKRAVYWVGFLEGALASKRIEDGEESAIFAEADNFAKFFHDPDASDLAEDLRSRCVASEDDLMQQMRDIIEAKREELSATASYSETDEVNEFLGFCAGIICDGRLLHKEVKAILGRFRESDVLITAAPFRQLHRAVEDAMADDILTDREVCEVQEWLALLVGDGFTDTGLPNLGSVARLDDPISDPAEVELEGANFVLTGPMRMGTRGFIVAEIERAGGFYEARTTRSTDYVVVSADASKNWRTTHFGNKIERAQELIDGGYKLRFVSETALQLAIAMATRDD